MKALVLYDSKFGNTRQVAEAIGDTLRSYGEVRMSSVAEAQQEQASGHNGFDGYDLLVAGCPTQSHGISPAFQSFLEAVPGDFLKGKTALIFDTRYQMPRWLTGSAAAQLISKFKSLGCTQVVPPESFFVIKKEGPLVEGELERAAEWVKVALVVTGLTPSLPLLRPVPAPAPGLG
jgi:flavodoxin